MTLGERQDGRQKKDGEKATSQGMCVPSGSGKKQRTFLSRVFNESTPLLTPYFSPVRPEWDFCPAEL